jgi:hypothetical protein
MASITTRQTGTTGVGGVTRKDSPLTNTEIDNNFIAINNAKLEISDTTDANTSSAVVRRNSSGGFSAGAITATSLTATTISETSSIALKENVTPISEALNCILSLNGVTYDRKDGSAKKEAGLIAEEVNQILPNLVTKDKEGNPEGINYTKLTAYLIEAIKELKIELNSLKGIK